MTVTLGYKAKVVIFLAFVFKEVAFGILGVTLVTVEGCVTVPRMEAFTLISAEGIGV